MKKILTLTIALIVFAQVAFSAERVMRYPSGMPTSVLGTDTTASDIPIADAGTIISATEVEGALQENRTALDLNTIHSTDNTQAHTDYLINNGNDTTSGILTSAGYIVGDGQTVGATTNKWLFDDTNGDISTTGNVGIGTAAPAATLDVTALAYSPGVSNEFTGNGLNDMTIGGGYTGTGTPTFTVVIDGVNTIKTSTLGTGGADYAEDDTFTINNGTVLATGTVVTVNTGAVVTYSLSTNGAGYWVADDFGTVATSGSGTGLEINVTVLVDTFKWKKDAGAYTENVEVTGASQLMQEGVTVTFASIVGHNSVNNFTLTHTTTAGVAPVNKTITYGVVATDIGGTGTKYWITQNLGATNQATSADDATEPSAGWYWQFNRKQGFKHDGTTRTPSTWDATTDDSSATWESAKDPCTLLLGSGWRLPTYTEYLNADAAPQSWANYNDTYASVLKLHAAGYLSYSTGALSHRGSSGLYWSSTQYSSTHGYHLNFSSSLSNMGYNYKAHGFGVRGLRDDAPLADTWTVTGLATTFYDTAIFRDYAGTAQLSILVSGNVGIGTTDPTARLMIKEGTATAGTAPIKFTAGVVNSSSEAGALEWDGTDLWISF